MMGVTIADLLGDQPFIKENNQPAATKETHSMTCQILDSIGQSGHEQHIINRPRFAFMIHLE